MFSKIIVPVICALINAEVNKQLNFNLSSLIRIPANFASLYPLLVKPGFSHPVNRFFSFHSLCP